MTTTMKKPETKTKSLRFKVKDADQGLVTAVFATFNVMDYDYDYTLPGAFEDGAKVLISAYGHTSWRGNKPVGTGVIHFDETKAWMDGQFFMDTIEGLDTFRTIKGTGELQEWSYGYEVLETGEVTEEMRQRGIWRVIKKSRVYEVCPVMLGAGVGTETLNLKGRGADESDLMDQPTPTVVEPTAEEIARLAEQKAAEARIATDARGEFAKFQKTRARLTLAGTY